MTLVRVLLAVLLLLAGGARGAEYTIDHTADDHLAAVELARNVSEITGTAISPLLGVSSVGAWRYYRTPAAQREQLPWFCHPTAWTIGFAVLALCFLKDLFGTAAPTVLKKPLDYLELFENKLSALVATSAFVPIIAAELARHTFRNGGDAGAPIHAAGMLFPELSGFAAVAVTTLFAVSAFTAVFLASHVINVLVALSPFTIVDAALKSLKLGLLTLVTATTFVSPWISMGICVAVVLVAAMIAPWAFRFSLFGTIFAWDTVSARLLRRKPSVDLAEPRCFTARAVKALPVRTLGRVSRNAEGGLVFRYRPWLILPKRTLRIADDQIVLSKGILCPAIQCYEDREKRHREVLLLFPRYCTVAEGVARELRIDQLRDGSVVGGLKAAKAWLAEMFSFGGRTPARIAG